MIKTRQVVFDTVSLYEYDVMIFLPLPLAKTIKLCQRAESTLLLGHQRTLTGRATAVGQGGRCWMLWSSTGFEMGRMGRISLHLTHFLRISDANL